MSFTKEQRSVTLAAYLGWTLDAFDFFLMVFILKDIAKQFNTGIPNVALAITLTLAMRPIGAFIFGRLADRFGRKPILMVNVLCYACLQMLSGFSTSLGMLICFRVLFGLAMGGEWGVGAAITMETIPPRARGRVSGLLQAGYPTGYLLAILAFYFVYPHFGWRAMFFVGALPALLVLYIRLKVPESPVWKKLREEGAPRVNFFTVLAQNWKLALYSIVLMTAFNFFSHGSQDLYPTFLRVQHGFDVHTVTYITLILNVGAIIGGILVASLSEKFGRRRSIACAAVFSLLVLPLWAFSHTVVLIALGGFLMQIGVQGAWGVIPAHLNEISPASIRATFPGLVYQVGNLLASINATFQANIAVAHHNNYGYAMAVVAGTVAVIIAVFILFGPEKRGEDMTEAVSKAA